MNLEELNPQSDSLLDSRSSETEMLLPDTQYSNRLMCVNGFVLEKTICRIEQE